MPYRVDMNDRSREGFLALRSSRMATAALLAISWRTDLNYEDLIYSSITALLADSDRFLPA